MKGTDGDKIKRFKIPVSSSLLNSRKLFLRRFGFGKIRAFGDRLIRVEILR